MHAVLCYRPKFGTTPAAVTKFLYNNKLETMQVKVCHTMPTGLNQFERGKINALHEHSRLLNRKIAEKLRLNRRSVDRIICCFKATKATAIKFNSLEWAGSTSEQQDWKLIN